MPSPIGLHRYGRPKAALIRRLHDLQITQIAQINMAMNFADYAKEADS